MLSFVAPKKDFLVFFSFSTLTIYDTGIRTPHLRARVLFGYFCSDFQRVVSRKVSKIEVTFNNGLNQRLKKWVFKN